MSANVVDTQGDPWDNWGNETTPGDASTSAEGLTTNDYSGVEMAAPHATGSLAARLDGCPSCIINSEVPFGAFQPPAGGLVALYRCTDCGHRWHTSWAKESAA